MCYDKAYLAKKQEKYANRYAVHASEVEYLKAQLNKINLGPVYHASGFDHPEVPVIIGPEKKIELYSWGLIPRWVKSPAEAVKISNSTINARSETMFEKPAFREPARNQRCLVLVDGFFEHHHKGGKTFPYHIKLKNDEPMTLAGLWDEWVDQDSGLVRRTYTVVTTRANPLMARIHNNPKAEEGPRMPLILPKKLEMDWLKSINTKADQELFQELIQPYDENELETFTVRRLRGKEAIGNKPEAQQQFAYAELEQSQGELF
ncbi:MAG: SOS response-associated peptidase [Cyclobacteriaceae bacterium]|nr:SOS response-associated peptidase [Cyclobacteriaceae bacterium]